MEVTVRIDGNRDYEYAKQHLTLINDVIYVVETDLNGRLSLHLLNNGYITYTYSKYSENVPELLKLIKKHYHDVVMAIKFIQKMEHGLITDVADVKGLTISDW